MKRDEEPILLDLARRLESIDGLYQQRRHTRSIGGCGADRLGRQALAGNQLVKDLHGTISFVHPNVRSELAATHYSSPEVPAANDTSGSPACFSGRSLPATNKFDAGIFERIRLRRSAPR